jgi:hypothetical protein
MQQFDQSRAQVIFKLVNNNDSTDYFLQISFTYATEQLHPKVSHNCGTKMRYS